MADKLVGEIADAFRKFDEPLDWPRRDDKVTLTIELDADDVAHIAMIAQKRDISPSALIARWIRPRLHRRRPSARLLKSIPPQ